jgi:hypothetical protein
MFSSNLAVYSSNQFSNVLPLSQWLSNNTTNIHANISNLRSVVNGLSNSISFASNTSVYCSNGLVDLGGSSAFGSNLASWLSNNLQTSSTITNSYYADTIPTLSWTSNMIATRVPYSEHNDLKALVVSSMTNDTMIHAQLFQTANWASNTTSSLVTQYQNLSNVLSNVVSIMNVNFP